MYVLLTDDLDSKVLATLLLHTFPTQYHIQYYIYTCMYTYSGAWNMHRIEGCKINRTYKNFYSLYGNSENCGAF